MQRLRLAFVTGTTPDKWARVWRERHPEIPLELVPVAEDEQRAGIDDGSVDLALVRLPVDVERPTPLHCVRLYDEQQVAVAGREHLIAAADEVQLDDLGEEQLVLPHRSGWTPAVQQLDWPAMSVREAVETVAAGTGVVLLPQSVARGHARKDVVSRPVTDLDPTTVALVWRRADDSPVHQDFVGVTKGRGARSSR